MNVTAAAEAIITVNAASPNNSKEKPVPSGSALVPGSPPQVARGGQTLELQPVVIHSSHVAPFAASPLSQLPPENLHKVVEYLGFKEAAALLQTSTYFQEAVRSDPRLQKALPILRQAQEIMERCSRDVRTNAAELAVLQTRAQQLDLDSLQLNARIDAGTGPVNILACLSCIGILASGIAAWVLSASGTPAPPPGDSDPVGDALAQSIYQQQWQTWTDPIYKSLYAMGGFAIGPVLFRAFHAFARRVTNRTHHEVESVARALRLQADKVRRTNRFQEFASRKVTAVVFHLADRQGDSAARNGDGVATLAAAISSGDLGRVTAGVRELLAAPESLISRDDNIRFLQGWIQTTFDGAEPAFKSAKAFIKEVIESNALTVHEKIQICLEGVDFTGMWLHPNSPESPLIALSVMAAMQRSTSPHAGVMLQYMADHHPEVATAIWNITPGESPLWDALMRDA